MRTLLGYLSTFSKVLDFLLPYNGEVCSKSAPIINKWVTVNSYKHSKGTIMWACRNSLSFRMQISFITAKNTGCQLSAQLSILQVKYFFTTIHNLPESISKVSCMCLSETVLLPPQRQHGTLAWMQSYELKLWPWHHLGDHSYAVSTFPKPPPAHLWCADAPRTLISGFPPSDLGGGGGMHAGQE